MAASLALADGRFAVGRFASLADGRIGRFAPSLFQRR
jgi:hypothetical protein